MVLLQKGAVNCILMGELKLTYKPEPEHKPLNCRYGGAFARGLEHG